MIGIPKPRPRVLEQQDDDRALQARKRRVNAEVDARDERRCQCCHRRGNPDSLTALGKIHRAHIVDASRGGPYDVGNLVSLCWICHALEHAKQLWIVGATANTPIGFEIEEAAMVHVFGTRALPAHVRIIAPPRRRA